MGKATYLFAIILLFIDQPVPMKNNSCC